jgi:tetratricopeptide (TPR) repeat protein
LKIRIKIKHLVLVLSSAALLIPLLYFIIIPRFELFAAERQFEKGDLKGKKQIIQVLSNPISDESKWDLIRKYMIQQDNSIRNSLDVFVGPGSSQVIGGDQYRHTFSKSEKLPYLLDYIQNGPVNFDYAQAAKQASQYYISEGKFNSAVDIIDQALDRVPLDDYQNKELKYEKAKLYVDNNQLEQAEQLLAELKANDNPQRWGDIEGKAIQLQAQILIEQGSIQEALTFVDKELQTYEQLWKSSKPESTNPAPGTPVILTTLETLRDSIERTLKFNNDNPSLSIVSGTVKRNDGTPLPHVGVFLRQHTAVYHSVIDGEPYQTTTDASGNFQFRGVLPGNYQLFLGLSFDQINGWTWPVQTDDWITIKGNEHLTQEITIQPLLEVISPVNQQEITDKIVNFQWEKVEGAAYYQLNGNLPLENGTLGTVIQTNIKENHVELSVEQLYDLQTGLSYENPGDFSSVVSSLLLGYADPNSRFSWNVEAYDANNKLITRSNGYRLNEDTIGNLPFYYLKERTLTAIDELVREGHLDEALIAYKQQVELDPTDIHSLRMTIRLLEAKASVMDDDQFEDDALPYLKQMMKMNPSETYAYRLVKYYYKREQWNEFNQAYSIYKKLSKDADSYTQSLYAIALMKQGQMDKAYEQFEIAIPQDKSRRFVGYFLAVDLYRSGSFDSALKLANKYPELTYDSQTRNWAELIKQIQQEAVNSSSYLTELRETLDWVFQSDKKQLDDWKASTKLTHMKSFIEALLKVS